MARQPEKGKSAIQTLLETPEGKLAFYNMGDNRFLIQYGRHEAFSTSPELAARALLNKLYPTGAVEKKKLTRGGVK